MEAVHGSDSNKGAVNKAVGSGIGGKKRIVIPLFILRNQSALKWLGALIVNLF
jgi:hypothetical protein